MFMNLKISAKLITGFLIVAILAAVVGTIGVVEIGKLKDSDAKMYIKMTEPLGSLGDLRNAFQRERGNTKDIILVSDPAAIADYKNRIATRRSEVNTNLEAVGKTIFTAEGTQLMNDLRAGLTAYYKEADKVIALAEKNDDAAAHCSCNKRCIRCGTVSSGNP